jgi:hypothetical protein
MINFTKSFKMSKCKSKIKQNCGTIVYASCVRYESEVSANSELDPQSGCISIEETTQDIYNQLDVLDEKIDMSSIESSCVTLTEPRTPASVITQLYDKLCELEATVEAQGQTIITLQGQIAELQSNPCS